MKYYKILPEDLSQRGFQCHEGLNIETNEVSPFSNFGLYFSDSKHILNYADCGTMIADVEIPEDAIVYHFTDQCKADRIILHNIRPLYTIENFIELVNNGVEIDSYKDHILFCSSRNNSLDIVKYIVEHGADVNCYLGSPLEQALRNNSLDIVKVLVEHGADINRKDSNTMEDAAWYGNFELFKYLVEHGGEVGIVQLEAAYDNGHKDICHYIIDKFVKED